MPATEKEQEDWGKVVALVGGVGLAGLGVYLAVYKKGAGFHIGDKVTLGSAKFTYTGPAQQVWVCWGLKKGAGNFNDGENLEGDVFAYGGPIQVEAGSELKYSFVPKDDFDIQPVLYLDPKIILQPMTYSTWKWVCFGDDATANEDYILGIEVESKAIEIVE